MLLIALSMSFGATAAQRERATLIYVDKSEHLMYVFAKTKKIATYKVGFGTGPIGPKEREGDKRTPEGAYVLDYKKADSDFFKAIHISYPNSADRAKARKLGVRPGGAIMIHGQPNNVLMYEAVRRYPFPDWTDGCIALSDADMQSLWNLVTVPTPIRIVP
jgi:murein L,D-transpeptidase YafK